MRLRIVRYASWEFERVILRILFTVISRVTCGNFIYICKWRQKHATKPGIPVVSSLQGYVHIRMHTLHGQTNDVRFFVVDIYSIFYFLREFHSRQQMKDFHGNVHRLETIFLDYFSSKQYPELRLHPVLFCVTCIMYNYNAFLMSNSRLKSTKVIRWTNALRSKTQS